MKNLTTESFKEKVFDYENNTEWSFNGKKPAVIDFFASWRTPCKTIGPILNELDNEFENVDFYKVDTENQPELAQTFQIRSIPALLLIPLNEKPQMTMGMQPKEQLVKMMKEVFKLE